MIVSENIPEKKHESTNLSRYTQQILASELEEVQEVWQFKDLTK